MITAAQLKKISKSKTQKKNLLDAVCAIADQFKPHQLAHVLAQTMHESGGLVYDREVWGPTAAQQKYEGRKDLGNTQKGDGSKFRGYGPIQVTGRANTTAFYKWCVKQGLNPPDFTDKPELMAQSPWAGWSVVWYWDTRNLNKYADINDIEMMTRAVNGGLNGFDDRCDYYVRAALVLLGYAPTDVKGFQRASGMSLADGIGGPQTRGAMHKALVALTPGEAKKDSVRAAPVVEQTTVETVVRNDVPVAVTSPSFEAPWYKSKETWTPLIGSSGTALLGTVAGIPWQNMALLVGAGVLVVGALLVLKRKDQKIVEARAAAINATAPTVTTTTTET